MTNTLIHELGETAVLVIETQKRRYYEPNEPLFGKKFEDRFIFAAYELDEAAKCLALGRSTASVFHLMRMMEIGVRAIARCLKIPDPVRPADRNWGAILKNVRTGIDVKWPTVAARSIGTVPFLMASTRRLMPLKILGATPQCTRQINIPNKRLSTFLARYAAL